MLINCKKGIEVIFDHKPLTTIKNTATKGRLIKLLNYLAEYDAEITYRKGKDNIIVNYTQLEEQQHAFVATKKRKHGRPKKVKKPEVTDKNDEFKLLQVLSNQNSILNTDELIEHQKKDEIIKTALSTEFHLDYLVRKIDGVVKIKINDDKNVTNDGSNHF
uniref:Late transcription unit B protein n=1 Tax=Strongyloides venezuelensis TaxID=75913 RepID=A0A0K0G4G2_STRVS